MFTRCVLNLLQSSKSNNPPASLKVTISKPHVGGAGRAATRLEDIWLAIGKGYEWSGSWLTGANNINHRVDTTYTIGTSVPKDKKFWRYSIGQRQLEFVEAPLMTGAPGYGGTQTEIQIAAILHGCMVNGQGFVPSSPDAPGQGIIVVNSLIFQLGALEWEKGF